VDDLVDVSRITQDKITLNLARVDLTDLVSHAAETARPLFVEHSHELSIDVPDHPLPVTGDSVRLIQVISNLLNNAARYTDDGGRIALGVKRVGAQVVLTVTDNGLGIPPDMLERVFDMFAQLEARADQPREGLGIGLALVKRLVEMHGGVVEAKSEGPGRGSQFLVTLPALADRRDERLVSEAAPEALGAKRKRILIVDDNVDAAQVLFALLRLQRHEVEVAHDGVAALDIARTMNPDIVFLDLRLPKLDGIEVARRLREGTDGTRPLLVALTGLGQEEDRKRTAAVGFNHHLTKPVDLEVVRSVISGSALSSISEP
jgi:CheY-like chemotaxis protein